MNSGLNSAFRTCMAALKAREASQAHRRARATADVEGARDGALRADDLDHRGEERIGRAKRHAIEFGGRKYKRCCARKAAHDVETQESLV